jgi:hypothetical protein
MLLLTLILWWARAPMRLFDGRLRTAIAIVAIVILAFPCGTVTPSCIADDRFNADPGRSALVSTGDAKQKRPGSLPKNQQRLREGTLVPQTVGRILLRGRRWEFVSETARSRADDAVAATNQRRTWLVGFQPPARPTYQPSARSTHQPPARPTQLGSSTRTTGIMDRAETLASVPAAEKARGPALPMSIILTENLLLQRVAEAIRANPSDDQWVVSGEITEFFDENRLIIRTAQRSNAK